MRPSTVTSPPVGPGVPDADPGMSRFALATSLIILAALAIRVAFVMLSAAPAQSALVYDEANYHEAATRLLSRGYFAYGSGPVGSHPNAATMPGYTAFVAVVFSAFGSQSAGIRAVWVVQALLSALTVWLACLVGTRVGGKRAGLISAIVVGFYPPLVYANASLMGETLFTLALSLLAWASLLCLQRPSVRRYLSLGLLTGLATMIRPEAVILTGASLVVLAWYGRAELGRAAGLALVCVAGLLVVLTPWWVRNYEVYHRVVVTTTLTANPLLAATYWPGPPPTDVAIWPTSSSSDEFALNTRWQSLAMQRVRSQLRADPVRLVAVRLGMVWNAAIVPHAMPFLDGSPMSWQQIWLNRVTRLGHWLLLLLAGAAVIMSRHRPQVQVLSGLLILRFMLYAASFPLSRYALPSMPLAAVLAALFVTQAVIRRDAPTPG